MKNIKQKLICIVGATASGKTGLGVELAKKFDGEIVSADSRQVFRRLDIGTGKDLEEYGDIKHHLVDICDPGEDFSLFDWLDKAKKVIEDIWSRGKVPIIVGGTGLYVQALVEGFETEPTRNKKQDTNNKQISKFKREELEGKSKEDLAEILIDLDEEAFLTIDLNNPYRIVRAIEKATSEEKLTKTKPDFDYILIGKELEREELYSRIDYRVEEWFAQGFYEEVEGLLNSGVSLEWLNKIGLEYRILANYIEYQKSLAQGSLRENIKNENLEIKKLIDNCHRLWRGPAKCGKNCKLKIENFSSLDTTKQAMKYAIHQYARRQLIWWRRFEVNWVENANTAIQMAKNFLY